MNTVRVEIDKPYGLIVHNQSPKIIYGLKVKVIDLKDIPQKLHEEARQALTKERNLVVPNNSATDEMF